MAIAGPKLHQSSYLYLEERGFSRSQIDTYFPIVLAMAENRVTDAKTLLREVLRSEGQSGVQQAELFKKTFIEYQKKIKDEIDAAEEQKRLYELQLKQKADLEEEFQRLSIQEESIKNAIRENEVRKESIINQVSLEIAKNLKTCVFPSGKRHFENKNLDEITAFVKDLILTDRDLKQKLEAERKTGTKLVSDIQDLERIKQRIISKLELEQSQAAAPATYNPLIRASQSNTPAVAKSCLPKNPTLAQPKMAPANSSASAASAAASSSSRAEYPAPMYHMMASAAAAVAAKPTNMQTQAQRASSASASTAAFTASAIVAAASSNNAALPPRQSAAPKLQLPPLPSSSPLKPKAPAVQARTATTSAALPSTLAAKAAAAASSSSASAPTHIVIVTPAPVYLVQAKAPAKPPVSKPNAKQAPIVAPRALPPTPCHAAMATASRASVISVPGPERSGARPSK